ncbi:MAG: hypothetical protein ACREDT_16075, partial [Methylocella sp.]
PISPRASIPDLSPVSRDGRVVELCIYRPQEDADIIRLGTAGRQGEDFLQLPAKLRIHRRFPERPNFGFLESALVRRQGAALKAIILRSQIHPGYSLIV